MHSCFCRSEMVVVAALLLMRLTPFKASFAYVFNVAVAVVFVRFATFDVAIDGFVFVPFPAFRLDSFACVVFGLAADAADVLFFCRVPFGFSF